MVPMHARSVESQIFQGTLFHNFIRPNDALNGRTPTDLAEIKVERAKGLLLIQNARVNEPSERKKYPQKLRHSMKIPEVGSLVSFTRYGETKLVMGRIINATEIKYSGNYAARIEQIVVDGESEPFVRIAYWVKSPHVKNDYRWTVGKGYWIFNEKFANQLFHEARKLGILV